MAIKFRATDFRVIDYAQSDTGQTLSYQTILSLAVQSLDMVGVGPLPAPHIGSYSDNYLLQEPEARSAVYGRRHCPGNGCQHSSGHRRHHSIHSVLEHEFIRRDVAVVHLVSLIHDSVHRQFYGRSDRWSFQSARAILSR